MANNYTLASFTIDVPKDVDASVLKLAMGVIEDMVGLSFHSDSAKFLEAYKSNFSDKAVAAIMSGLSLVTAADVLFTFDHDYLGFDWTLKEDDEARCLWLTGEESIDIESAVLCVQLLAQLVPALKQSAPWYAEWANTCSRMRVDEFGGGAVVFDADFAEWTNTRSWREATMENFATIKAAQSVPIDPPAGG